MPRQAERRVTRPKPAHEPECVKPRVNAETSATLPPPRRPSPGGSPRLQSGGGGHISILQIYLIKTRCRWHNKHIPPPVARPNRANNLTFQMFIFFLLQPFKSPLLRQKHDFRLEARLHRDLVKIMVLPHLRWTVFTSNVELTFGVFAMLVMFIWCLCGILVGGCWLWLFLFCHLRRRRFF